MWYDELGPVLEPLLGGLAADLRASTLAVWLLRLDGRHFLEETPLPQTVRVASSRTAKGLFQSESNRLYSGFEPVEVIDSEDPPDQVLVLESIYPSFVRPPVGCLRPLPSGSPIYSFANPSLSSVGEAIPPDEILQASGYPFGLPWTFCRLPNRERVMGVVAFPPVQPPLSTPDFDRIWANHLAGWERLQIEASLARRTEILEAVQAVGNTITSQLEIHDILQSVVEQATVLLRAKIASLMLVDESRRELVLESVYGSSPDYIRKPNLDIENSLIGNVVKTGRPIRVRDVRSCPAYSHRELARSEGLVSLLSVPLKWRNECIGALNVYSPRRYRYTEDSAYLLSLLASQCAIAIQNARSVRQAKRLEEQVHDLDKRSMVGELAAGVAHEIRNPLAVVKMLIESWVSTDFTQNEDVKVITTQINGINRCVTQLLETAGSHPPVLSAVDLAGEISNILKLLRVRLRDQSVETVTSLPDDLTPVRADASRLRQLLMNLLLNALNAMPTGGRIAARAEPSCRGRIEDLPGVWVVPPPAMSKAPDGQTGVLLSLSDTGGGIREGDVREIFEPFKTRTPGGFGLGLSVVKRIIEEHEAALKVDNQPGRGVTFHLFFQPYPPYA